MPETGSRNDPYSAFNFLVEIDNVTVAGFSEVSGLTTETDAIDYRNGDEDIIVRKLPGLKKVTKAQPIINSTSAEAERLEKVPLLAKKYNARLIALTMGKSC